MEANLLTIKYTLKQVFQVTLSEYSRLVRLVRWGHQSQTTTRTTRTVLVHSWLSLASLRLDKCSSITRIVTKSWIRALVSTSNNTLDIRERYWNLIVLDQSPILPKFSMLRTVKAITFSCLSGTIHCQRISVPWIRKSLISTVTSLNSGSSLTKILKRMNKVSLIFALPPSSGTRSLNSKCC